MYAAETCGKIHTRESNADSADIIVRAGSTIRRTVERTATSIHATDTTFVHLFHNPP